MSEECLRCDGDGKLYRFSHDDGTAAIFEPYDCPVCDGTGWRGERPTLTVLQGGK